MVLYVLAIAHLRQLEVPEHLSLLYPIQLKGRMQLDKNDASTPGAREENNTSLFESTPPIINADEIRRLAKIVVKIESLAGGKVHKEPSEIADKGGEKGDDEEEEQRAKHFVQLDTDMEDESDDKDSDKDNDDNASTLTEGTETEKGMSRASSRSKSRKKKTTPQRVYSVVPSNLLAPAVQDGASDEEMVSILEALVSRINNAINTMNVRRVRMTLENGHDKDKDELIERLLKITM